MSKNKNWMNSYIHLKCVNIWHNSWFYIQEFLTNCVYKNIILTFVHLLLVLTYEYSIVCMLILFMPTLNFEYIIYIELWYTWHFHPNICTSSHFFLTFLQFPLEAHICTYILVSGLFVCDPSRMESCIYLSIEWHLISCVWWVKKC